MLDEDSLEVVKGYKWFVSESGYAIAYAKEGRNKAHIRMHHIIAGFPIKGYEVSHKDQTKLNNTRENLEHVTHLENVHLWAKTTKGYYWDKKRKKWQVSLTLDGKRFNGGRFSLETEAAARAAFIRSFW